MIVLITGASGFIGSHLAEALHAEGHTVIRLRRGPTRNADEIQGDFSRDLDPEVWIPRLRGIDMLINTVGIIRERPGQSFQALHSDAPRALFTACAIAGVRRIIQISALGADRGTSAYYLSKRCADDFLATQPLDWTILQPAIVYGRGGASAQFFTMLASLPLIPVPGRGEQRLQPIHIDDLIDAICSVVRSGFGTRQRVQLCGPRSVSLRKMLGLLRQGMQMGSARFVFIPTRIMRGLAFVGAVTGIGLLDSETLAMLEHGNTADSRATRQLLHHAPRPVDEFVSPSERAGVVLSAKLAWLLPLLRISIAVVWIWTGIVSLGLYPREASYQLLARTFITGGLAGFMLNAAAIFDIGLGLATLLLRHRRPLWRVQMATLLLYTLIISAALPEFWLHPYGPILKNLPLLAAIYLLHNLEDSRWNTSS